MDQLFCKGVAEALQAPADSIAEDTPLGENWDSVAMMTTISLVDHLYNVTVSGAELEACRTVGNLWNLVQSSRS